MHNFKLHERQLSNTQQYTLMPVTHGPTSWMRHIVCDFGSTWGDTRYDLSW